MVIKFNFIPVEEMNAEIFAVLNVPQGKTEAEAKAEIEDSVASYIDAVPAWEFKQMVQDVLSQSGYDFEIIQPAEINV